MLCLGWVGHSYLRPAYLSRFQDLFNDLFACGFLIGGVVFAWNARRTMPMAYVAAMVRCFC